MRLLPSSRNCFVCGVENKQGLHLKFYLNDAQEIEAPVVIPDLYQGYPGMAHGGIIASILDETAGRMFLVDSSKDRIMVTSKLDIRYHKPVPVDTPLKAFGKIKEDREKVAFCTSKIVDLNGELLASAEVVFVRVPSDKLAAITEESRYWKVYPETEGEK